MMFLIVNQDGYFLGKSGNWLDGREPSALYRSLHKDEALNQLFEANSRDFTLRLSLISCEANNKGFPMIASDQLPPPLVSTNIAISEQPDLCESEAMAS